ncbi:hypothetical protein V6Z11_A12G263200 [Gossypium hirsutum]
MEVNKEKYAADLSIQEARARSSLHAISGRRLFFKYECFQKGEVSIFRGARNAIFSLDDQQAAEGVVTHSSGNHAAELALAAKLGSLHMEETAANVLQETGAALTHAHDDGRIISGQGTISLELLEQAPHIDTIRVPISGGGLKSGVALAANGGRIVTLPETNTVADGLRAFLGEFTWIYSLYVDNVITVDDTEKIKAMRLCYEILKVAVEPSGAIGLAGVLSDSFRNNPAWKE